MNETEIRKLWESQGERHLELFRSALLQLSQAGYWEKSEVMGMLAGPVLWSIFWVGIVLNVCVFTVDTIASRCSPGSLLTACFSGALMLRGVLWLSLLRQAVGRSACVRGSVGTRLFDYVLSSISIIRQNDSLNGSLTVVVEA